MKELRAIFGDKINIGTISPASLVKYYKVKNPSPPENKNQSDRLEKEQRALGEDLGRINNFIKDNNTNAGVETINWADYLFRNSLKRRRT